MTARHSTKGQVKLTETILVLFIIVLIISLGMFFYFRYSIEKVKIRGVELSERETSILLAKITTMPEIACENENCVDASKLLPFITILRDHQSYYGPLFGAKKITIERLYPAPATQAFCTTQMYNQADYPTNCHSWVIYDNKPSSYTNNPRISTPISLYFPEFDTYHIGRLTIEVYL